MRDLEFLIGSGFNINHVDEFLSLLFNDSDIIDIEMDNVVLILSIKTITGKSVRKAKLPVNIKNNDILGWFCEDYNLCCLPLRNGKFMVKHGCGRNKHIRSLHMVF